MRRDDRVRLQHMLDAAEDAIRFAFGLTRRDLDANRMAMFAIVRAVEIIGEAAATVTDDTRQAHGGFPWRDMVAMRNRLIHAYYDISSDQRSAVTPGCFSPLPRAPLFLYNITGSERRAPRPCTSRLSTLRLLVLMGA